MGGARAVLWIVVDHAWSDRLKSWPTAFLAYKAIGITQFIISGWPKLEEMMIFGREVIPLVQSSSHKKAHDAQISVLSHFADRLREAEVSLDPYPHYCLENVFPDDYYQELLRNLPASDSYNNLYEVTTLKLDHFRHSDQRDMNAGWTDKLPA